MKFLPESISIFRLNSVFFRIIIFFVGLILISILTVGAVSYYYSANLMVEEVKNSNMTLLRQAKDIIDLEISNLDKITLQMSFEPRIRKCFFVPREQINEQTGEYAHLFMDIKVYLNSINASTDFLSEVWVHFNKSGIVVSDLAKYDADLFFELNYPNRPLDEWESIMQENYAFRLLGRYEGNVAFIRSLPLAEAKPYAQVVMNVKEDVLKSLIGEVSGNTPVYIYVVDWLGNVIFSNEEPGMTNIDEDTVKNIFSENKEILRDAEGFFNREINGKRYMIAAVPSNKYGWSYIAVIPTHYIMSKANIIKSVTVFVMAISLLIGLILSYLLTRRIYAPINKIVNFIDVAGDLKISQDRKEMKNEFGFIDKMVSYVYNEYKDIEKNMTRSIPVLREKFLSDLLNGRNLKPVWQDMTRTLKMDIDLNDYYVVIVFEAKDYVSYRHIAKVRTKGFELEIEEISKNTEFNDLKIFTLKKTDDIAVSLVNLGKEPVEPEIVYDFIKKVVNVFREKYDVTVTAGVGRMYNSADKVSDSYIEALRALEYKVIRGGSSIIQIDEVIEYEESSFDYPIEKEQQIINLVKSGDMEFLNKHLQEIFEKNLNRTDVSPELVYNLFNALISTAVRTIYEIHAEPEDIFGTDFNLYKQLNKYHSAAEKQEFIEEVFSKIVSYIDMQRKDQNMKVYDRVLDYIHNNYDRDISLDSVADAVGLSIQYISWIFKKTSGVNFVNYLNSYRVNKAKVLLKESSLSISEVGKKIGFNNTNNFIRVFKKYEGVTPGQFREANQSM